MQISSSKQIAAGVVLLFCIVLLLWLMLDTIAPIRNRLADETHPYITMQSDDEELIEVEVPKPIPSNAAESAPAQTAEDVDNPSQAGPQSGVDVTTQGEAGHPSQTVTTPRQSNVRETVKPTPAKSAAAIENERAKAEKAMAARTQNQLANAFAKAENKNNAMNGANDNGQAGRKDGNPNSAAGPSAKGARAGVNGQVGGGWRMPNYARNIASNNVGSVTFEVSVNADGTVGKIAMLSNRGLTPQTIRACEAEIRSKRFTNRNPETAEPATARVTFTFRDPQDI